MLRGKEILGMQFLHDWNLPPSDVIESNGPGSIVTAGLLSLLDVSLSPIDVIDVVPLCAKAPSVIADSKKYQYLNNRQV